MAQRLLLLNPVAEAGKAGILRPPLHGRTEEVTLYFVV